MSYEISQRFYFEAAHTLVRQIDAAGSARIHGHTYHAEVTAGGTPDGESGMVVDLGLVRQRIEALKSELDHQFLDEIQELGPPTLENLCAFIAKRINIEPAKLTSVRVWREATGDSCLLRIP